MSIALSGGTGNFTSTITASPTANRTLTLPDVTGTVLTSGAAISGTTGEFSSTIKGGSTISVGGATPAASGAGITFPATASASSDANTLDDYEEGTWTPAYSGGATWTYTTQAGRYIKVGNCVTHTFYIEATATITSTNAQVTITGLPFTSTGANSDGRTNGSCRFGPDFGTQQMLPTTGAMTWAQTSTVNDGNGWANTTNWPAATSRVHYGTFVILLT